MRVVLFAVVGLLSLVGVGCLAGTVSTHDPAVPKVHCGGPAVVLAFGSRYDDGTPCKDEATGQVTTAGLLFALSAGLGWGWHKSHPRTAPKPSVASSTGHHALLPTAGGAGVLRVNGHALVLEHPYLAEPLRLPRSAIVAVAPARANPKAPRPADPSRLAFGTPSVTNAVLVVDPPVDVGPFTNQGVRSLGLGGREAVPVQVLTFAVAGSADPLFDDLEHLGVPRVRTEASALARLGPAPAPPRDVRRLARLGIVAGGATLTLLFGLPSAVLGGQGADAGLLEVALALAVATAVAAAEQRFWPHAAADPDVAGRAAGLAVVSLVLAGAPALVAATVPLDGAQWALEWALAAGVPAGMLAGWALHIVDAPDLAWR